MGLMTQATADYLKRNHRHSTDQADSKDDQLNDDIIVEDSVVEDDH